MLVVMNVNYIFFLHFQKYQRLKSELNVKDDVENLELATPIHTSSNVGSGFDPKSLKHAYNFADYDEVYEPPLYDGVSFFLMFVLLCFCVIVGNEKTFLCTQMA